MKKPQNDFQKNHQLFLAAHRSFIGIVPVLEDAKLSCASRVLFHIISSFSFKEGYCYATNLQLSERLGLKATMIKRYLAELQENRLITVELRNTKVGIRRHIYVDFSSLRKKYLQLEKDVGNKGWNTPPDQLREQYQEYEPD